MSDQNGELAVSFDGACPLCSAEIGAHRNCVGADRVIFVDVSTAGAGTVAPELDRAAALKRFDVRLADELLASGATGFGHLWLALPAWRWLGRIVLLPGLLQLTEVLLSRRSGRTTRYPVGLAGCRRPGPCALRHLCDRASDLRHDDFLQRTTESERTTAVEANCCLIRIFKALDGCDCRSGGPVTRPLLRNCRACGH